MCVMTEYISLPFTFETFGNRAARNARNLVKESRVLLTPAQRKQKLILVGALGNNSCFTLLQGPN